MAGEPQEAQAVARRREGAGGEEHDEGTGQDAHDAPARDETPRGVTVPLVRHPAVAVVVPPSPRGRTFP